MSSQPCGCDSEANWTCSQHDGIDGYLNVPSKFMPPRPYHLLPEETIVTDLTTGGKKGSRLCQMGAVDPLALTEIGKVAGFGGEKYERYNFAKGYKWSLSYDALQRHLMAFWGGEEIDPESGLPHAAHAGWHCLALLTFMLRTLGTDDRFPR